MVSLKLAVNYIKRRINYVHGKICNFFKWVRIFARQILVLIKRILWGVLKLICGNSSESLKRVPVS